MTWYLRHHRSDRPVETIRCEELHKARRMCRDLQDVGEIAWIENERGLKLQSWDLWIPKTADMRSSSLARGAATG